MKNLNSTTTNTVSTARAPWLWSYLQYLTQIFVKVKHDRDTVLCTQHNTVLYMQHKSTQKNGKLLQMGCYIAVELYFHFIGKTERGRYYTPIWVQTYLLFCLSSSTSVCNLTFPLLKKLTFLWLTHMYLKKIWRHIKRTSGTLKETRWNNCRGKVLQQKLPLPSFIMPLHSFAHNTNLQWPKIWNMFIC